MMDAKSIALSLSLFSSTAALDEVSSRGMTEIGVVRNYQQRVALKAGVMVLHAGMVEVVKKKPKGVRWAVRYAVPAAFAGAALRNEMLKRRAGR